MFLLLLRNFNNLNWFLNGVINCIDDIVNGLIRNVFIWCDYKIDKNTFSGCTTQKSETEVIYLTQTFFRPKTFHLLITEGHSLSIQFNVCIYEYA